MLKTKKIFTFILLVNLFLFVFFPIIINAQAVNPNDGKVYEDVKIENVPVDDFCCFILVKDDASQRKFYKCAHQSSMDELKCTDVNKGSWEKCGAAGGKAMNPDTCVFYRPWTVEPRTKLINNNCCFCGLYRKVFPIITQNGEQCFNENIVDSSAACQAYCSKKGSIIDKSYSIWQKCDISKEQLIIELKKVPDTVFVSKVETLPLAGGGYLVDKFDQCFYTVATSTETFTNPNALKIKLNVKIPGLEDFSTGDGVVVDKETLSKYLAALYKFLIGIAAILAVIMIAYGGFLWLFSDGAGEKVTKAKEVIIAAISGLVLALGSYLLLNFINPNLVALKFPVNLVKISPTININNAAVNLKNIPDFNPPHIILNPAIDANHRFLDQKTIDKLLSVNLILSLPEHEGEQIMITEGFRTRADQVKLYAEYQAGGNVAAVPGHSAHETGLAVDACLIKNGVSSCVYLNQRCNNNNTCKNSAGTSAPENLPELQIELQNIMKQAGFTRFCGEWWHFEAEPLSTSCEPGSYTAGQPSANNNSSEPVCNDPNACDPGFVYTLEDGMCVCIEQT